MIYAKRLSKGLILTLATLTWHMSHAQTPNQYSEDFTVAKSSNQWFYYGGACMTAGTYNTTTNPDFLPACTSVLSSYYNKQSDADTYLIGGALGYLGSSTKPTSMANQIPDSPGLGALRFTNGAPFGHNESGAIVSNFTFPGTQGLQITFKSVTYLGNSGGNGGTGSVNANDGADGISFYLIDDSVNNLQTYPNTTTPYPGLGSFGGSLGYSCSNSGSHYPFDGLVGGYLGLGIDEYGNFLNPSDNTATGPGLQGNRIGLRGPGSVSWQYLNATYPNQYPTSLTSVQRAMAVYHTCHDGVVYDFSTGKSTWNASTVTFSGVEVGDWTTLKKPTTTPSPALTDYAYINNAYKVLTSFKIANETATTRGQATAITYNLTITPGTTAYPGGLLSLSYSTGGSYTSIISKQNLYSAIGTTPQNVRFGFAGSTGGSTNIHEIECFKVTPANQGGSSATANEKEAAKVEQGAQAFFAFYNPNDWTGSLAAYTLNDIGGNIAIGYGGTATTVGAATWDGSCVLSGVAAGDTCSNTGVKATTAVSAQSTRVMLTWNNSNSGIPFEWSNLTGAEQTALDLWDSTSAYAYKISSDTGYTTASRLNYLRGDRSNELNAAGTSGFFRARDSVLGDIVDSSPAWVGPPSSPYTTTWTDLLYPSAVAPENTGGISSYLSFYQSSQLRQNVVYAGANDGFLHGFRAGAINANGVLYGNGTGSQDVLTPNDGKEVLAYMPGALLQSAATTTGGGCTNINTTASWTQNIHGIDPAISPNVTCVDPSLDYSNPQYGHNFYVDAAPGTGDLYYNGAWHTWLVSGLGAGGADIFVLDVTDPTIFTESTANAAKVVIGEWTPSTLPSTCANEVTNCGNNLGNTYGTPVIRRLHAIINGHAQWGVIFGNGFGSGSGDAGIYIMTVDAVNGNKAFYYLSTGTANSGNGIAYVTPADVDGDHITDYVYAGDLKGNVWRFDLTSQTVGSWAVNTPALFQTQTGQPITTALLAITTIANGSPQMIIGFGTGRKTPVTNTSAATYITNATQSFYGIWDWNFTGWNGMSSTQYMALPTSSVSAPLTYSNLQQQVFTVDGTTLDQNGNAVDLKTVITGTNKIVCWKGLSLCPSNNQFGWYANLVDYQGSSAEHSIEQIVFSPEYDKDAFSFNSIVPADLTLTSCNPADKGFTYKLNMLTGGVFSSVYGTGYDSNTAALETDGSGTPFNLTTANGTTVDIMQTLTNGPLPLPYYVPSNTKAKRLTWIEKR